MKAEDDDEEEGPKGPCPEEAAEKFAELRKLNNVVEKSITKNGRKHADTLKQSKSKLNTSNSLNLFQNSLTAWLKLIRAT